MNGIASIPHSYFDDEDDDDFSFSSGGLAGIGSQGGERVYADDKRLAPYFSGIAAPLGQQAQQLARLGRGDDTMLLHVTPGELQHLQQLAKQYGGSLTINPQTGLPEMGFFSKLLKGIKKVAKKVWKGVKKFAGPIAGIAANIFLPGISPLMTGLISGAAGGLASGSLKKGLMDGLMGWGGAHLFGGGASAANAAGGGSHMVNPGVADSIGNAVSSANAASSLGSAGAGSGIAGTIGDAVSQAGGAGIYGGTYAAAAPAMNAASQLGTSAMTAATQPVASAAASNAMGQVANQGIMGKVKGILGAATKAENIPMTMAAINMAGGLLGQRESRKYEKQQRAEQERERRRAEELARPLYDHTQQAPAASGYYDYPSNPYFAISGYAKGGAVVDPATQKKISALRKRYRSMQQALDDARVPGSVAHSLGIHANDPALRAAFGFTKKQGPKPKKKQVMLASGGKVGMRGYAQGGGIASLNDGMSDDVPASIDGKQPARLSVDEFVVPADVVSHLGNGSSEAGANRLYEMMNRVRAARTGNTQQAPRIDPMGFMPA